LLLVWLLAALQGPVANPPHDLTSYLAIAARFRSADHSAAMGEIRSWTLPEIETAAAGLRRQGRRLRAVPEAPEDIDFRTVEAAVLLHADVGLASLQAMSFAEAEFHLDASVRLLEWSRHAAARARSFDNVRAYLDARDDRLPTHPRAIRDRIDLGDFYKALAGTARRRSPSPRRARSAASISPLRHSRISRRARARLGER